MQDSDYPIDLLKYLGPELMQILKETYTGLPSMYGAMRALETTEDTAFRELFEQHGTSYDAVREQIVDILPDDLVRRLETPVDIGQFQLGALPPHAPDID